MTPKELELVFSALSGLQRQKSDQIDKWIDWLDNPPEDFAIEKATLERWVRETQEEEIAIRKFLNTPTGIAW